MMDNASIHRSKPTTKVLSDMGLEMLYNKACRPDLHGVEHFFALAKAKYRIDLLRKMIDGTKFRIDKMATEAIVKVDNDKVKACAPIIIFTQIS